MVKTLRFGVASRLVTALVTIGVAACSSTSRSPAPSYCTNADCTDAGGGATTVTSCTTLCAHVATSGCPNTQPCSVQCQGRISSTTAACVVVLDKLQSCLMTATFACDANGDPVAQNGGCVTELADWRTCLDAFTGDAGTGDDDGGAAACNTCASTSCGPELQACTDDAACNHLGQCGVTCSDRTCLDACEAATPSAVDTYEAFLRCTATHCATACADELGGGPAPVDGGQDADASDATEADASGDARVGDAGAEASSDAGQDASPSDAGVDAPSADAGVDAARGGAADAGDGAPSR